MDVGECACHRFPGHIFFSRRRGLMRMGAHCSWCSRSLCHRQATQRAKRLLCVGDQTGAAFLAAFDTTTEEGHHCKACMARVANTPALAWATAVLGASKTRLRNDHFLVAGAHTSSLDGCTAVGWDATLPMQSEQCSETESCNRMIRSHQT